MENRKDAEDEMMMLLWMMMMMKEMHYERTSIREETNVGFIEAMVLRESPAR